MKQDTTTPIPYRELFVRSLFAAGMPFSVIAGLMLWFGHSVKITEELCRTFSYVYDWELFAEKLLSREGHDKFVAERERLDAEWDNAELAAQTDEDLSQAWKEYEHAVAALFARIYIEEGKK